MKSLLAMSGGVDEILGLDDGDYLLVAIGTTKEKETFDIFRAQHAEYADDGSRVPVKRLLVRVRVGLVDQRARPKIVCLCGSTRFMEAFARANFSETIGGNIVLSVGVSVYHSMNQSVALTFELKAQLDELHKRKIDLADEIFVLNVGGYIGESTASEIAYAQAHGKAVRFLERVEPEHFFMEVEK